MPKFPYKSERMKGFTIRMGSDLRSMLDEIGEHYKRNSGHVARLLLRRAAGEELRAIREGTAGNLLDEEREEQSQ